MGGIVLLKLQLYVLKSLKSWNLSWCYFWLPGRKSGSPCPGASLTDVDSCGVVWGGATGQVVDPLPPPLHFSALYVLHINVQSREPGLTAVHRPKVQRWYSCNSLLAVAPPSGPPPLKRMCCADEQVHQPVATTSYTSMGFGFSG